MTNFEKIKQMSKKELAQWLDKNGSFDIAPWSEWFDKKYCKQCETIICKCGDVNMKYAYCELNGFCKFFEDPNFLEDSPKIINLWLNAEE